MCKKSFSKLLPYMKSRLNSKSRPLNASDAAATKVLRQLKRDTTEKSLLNRIEQIRLWESYNYVLGDCEHNFVHLVVTRIAFQ